MNLSGPQSERDIAWQRSHSSRQDLPYPSSEKQVYESELSFLRSENSSLKDQLQRTLMELKAHQLRNPSPYSLSSVEADVDSEHPLFMMSSEVVSPLLEAYDIRIHELEDVVRQQNMKLENFAGKIEVLARENDELRESVSSPSHPPDFVSNSSPFNTELLSELTERLDLLMSENSLLTEQKMLLSTELDKHQMELQRRTSEVSSLSLLLDQNKTDMSSLTQKLIRTEKERDVAATHALSSGQSLVEMETKMSMLEEQIDVLKKKDRESELSLQEARRHVKELSIRMDESGSSSMRHVKQCEQRIHDLHEQLLQTKTELEVCKDTNRKLKSEYQSTRQDAEGMLQVMSGLERQVSEFSNRELEVIRQQRQARDELLEATSIRDQSVVRDEQNRREIDRLCKDRHNLSIQRKQDLDQAVEAVRTLMNQQIQKAEQELQQLSDRNAELMFESERSVRESRSLQSQLSRLSSLLSSERLKVSEELQHLSVLLKKEVEEKRREESRAIGLQDSNRDLRTLVDNLRQQIDSIRQQLEKQTRNIENERNTKEMTIRQLQKQISEQDRLLLRQERLLEETRQSSLDQINRIREETTEEMTTLRRRLLETEKTRRELENLWKDGGDQGVAMLDNLKQKYSMSMNELQIRLTKELEISKELSNQKRIMEGFVFQLEEELEETKQKFELSKQEVLLLRNTTNGLTEQLKDSFKERQEGVKRAAQLVEELVDRDKHHDVDEDYMM